MRPIVLTMELPCQEPLNAPRTIRIAFIDELPILIHIEPTYIHTTQLIITLINMSAIVLMMLE